MLAAEAFIYGFPLVFDLEQVDRFRREGMGSVAPAPFNSFSHRATRTKAGTYLLVPRGWDKGPAEGETVIHLPTAVATVVGRWAVDSEGDMGVVCELQAQLTLAPTSGGGAGLPSQTARPRMPC